ncbi:MAG: glutathione S-transferase family protein [Polyangiaceae bacterium]
MRLYHNPVSSNARRAVMTALQLNVPVELVRVDLAKGEQRQPDYLKMNPNGRVPVLDHDGFLLTESHAIMTYLADITPQQTLYPTAVRERADVNRWLFWSAAHFQPAVSVLNWEHMVKGILNLGPANPAEVARGERLFLECGRVLDAHLADRTWIAQDRLTLADIALSTPLMSLKVAKLPADDFKHLLAWHGRMTELDIWKKTSL